MYEMKLAKLLLIIPVFIVAVLWYISPIIKPLPRLTGLYLIGTQSTCFTDSDRIDPYTSDGQLRRVMVRFWYPSDLKSEQKYPYMGDRMPLLQAAFANQTRMPLWLSKLMLRDLMTDAYSNVPLSTKESAYPVVLFSHGLSGVPTDMYASIIENLASHGYIVVAIDHPYLNIITRFSTGEVVSSQAISDQFQRMNQQDQRKFQMDAIEVYKADMRLVIDQLELLNQDSNSIFYTHLDLDRIGVMGHSAGGTAAIEFCRSDDRCKAAADLDGWYDHVIGQEPLKQPLLLMFGSKSIERGEPTTEYLQIKGITREQYFEREQKIADHRKKLCSAPTCSMVIITGASHDDFGDGVLIKWPLRAWSAADSYVVLDQVNGQLVQFFDKYL